MIAAIPVFVQAKKPSAAIVTHTDVRKVLEIIKGDKAKTRTYCNMVKLGHVAVSCPGGADSIQVRYRSCNNIASTTHC